MQGSESESEGVRIGKSGRIEIYSCRTNGVNAALRECGVRRAAHYFFGSSVALAECALALEELEVDFGQSLATCPGRPQNIQRLKLKRRCRSCEVSFPSFPNLSERSGPFFILPELLLELLLPEFWALLPEVVGVGFLLGDLLLEALSELWGLLSDLGGS